MSERDMDDFFKHNAVPFSLGVSEARVIVQRRKSGEVFGFKFPVPGLDKYVRLLPSEMTVIGARAGTGKTAMLMQIAYGIEVQRMARNENSVVVIFSAEMNKAALALRLAAAKSGVSVADVLENDNLPPSRYDDVDRALVEVGEQMQVYVDETGSPSVEHMTEQLDNLKKERPIAAVLFDYLELAGGYKRYSHEYQRISEISLGLKRIANEYKCPVVTLAQLNRDIEGRTDKTPRMSDLAQGGEKPADRIVILVRDEDQDGVIHAHVVKNRNAPMGKAVLKFDGAAMKFLGAVNVRHELNQP